MRIPGIDINQMSKPAQIREAGNYAGDDIVRAFNYEITSLLCENF